MFCLHRMDTLDCFGEGDPIMRLPARIAMLLAAFFLACLPFAVGQRTSSPGLVKTVKNVETLEDVEVRANFSRFAVAREADEITPEASAPAGLQFVAVTPCRVADTRNATGAFGGPELAAASTRTFDIPQSACGIPATAVAYSLNVTVVPIQSLGFLTIWPAGQAQPVVSTLNSDGRVKANATITPAGTNGGISVYVTDATQFILDINGYFVPAGTNTAGLEFFPLTPCRVADTRNAAGALGGPFMAANTARAFPVQSGACGIPVAAKAYSFNVTTVPRGPLGFLTAWPSGQAQPVVSTLNSSTGGVVANAAIVPAGSAGAVSIFVSDATDVILDVNGYFAAPAAGGLALYTVTPCRAFDTRNGAGAFNGTLAVDIETSACAPPATAQYYVLNATVVPPGPLSYLTLWAAGGPQPDVSTLNADDGAVTSNMAIVPTSNGSIDAFATDSTQLILDLSGYFAPASPTVATPVFNFPSGTYYNTDGLGVSISDATPGATIYYTTDGSTPTTSSTKYTGIFYVSATYTGEFYVEATETVRAIAVATGYDDSSVATATYTVIPPAATPVFSLTPGGPAITGAQIFFNGAGTVYINLAPGETAYYSTDGSMPSATSTLYNPSTGIAITPGATSTTIDLQVVGVQSGVNNSAVASVTIIDNPFVYAQNILTTLTGTTAVTLAEVGTVPGSGAKPALLAGGVPVSNTLSGNQEFTDAVAIVGGPVLENSSTGSTVSLYVADNGSSISLSSYTVQTTTLSVADNTVTTIVTPLTAVAALPFATSNASTNVFLGNTTQGIAVAATGKASALLVPTNSDGSLNTGTAAAVKLSPMGSSTTSTVAALQMDNNANPGVVFGDGTKAGDNVTFFNQKGGQAATGTVGWIAPNSSEGANAPVIPAGANVTLTPASGFGTGTETKLYFASQAVSGGGANVLFGYIHPGESGAAPTVSRGMLVNPNGSGIPFGLVRNFIAGMGASSNSDIPTVIFLDQAAGAAKTDVQIWEFKITPNAAGAPTFTQIGSQTIAGEGGAAATINVTQSQAGLFITSNAQSGIYEVATGLGGSNDLAAPVRIGPGGGDITGMQDDANGNFIVQNIGENAPGFAGFLWSGGYLDGTGGATGAVPNPVMGSSEGTAPGFVPSALRVGHPF